MVLRRRRCDAAAGFTGDCADARTLPVQLIRAPLVAQGIIHKALINKSVKKSFESVALLTVALHSTVQPFKPLCFGSTQDEYQLHLGEYTGNAGDALANAHTAPPEEPTWAFPGIKFSTYDHLNDSESRCIRHSKSGWWFSR